MMKMLNVTTASTLAALISFSAMADSEHHPEQAVESSSAQVPKTGSTMPMAPGQGGMMGKGAMPMMDPQMMKKRMAMKQKHMQTMETHLANIEALLRELVKLEKKK